MPIVTVTKNQWTIGIGLSSVLYIFSIFEITSCRESTYLLVLRPHALFLHGHLQTYPDIRRHVMYTLYAPSKFTNQVSFRKDL